MQKQYKQPRLVRQSNQPHVVEDIDDDIYQPVKQEPTTIEEIDEKDPGPAQEAQDPIKTFLEENIETTTNMLQNLNTQLQKMNAEIQERQTITLEIQKRMLSAQGTISAYKSVQEQMQKQANA